MAFTRRSKKWNGGVLDIIKSSGDYVLGVVYEIPEEAISAIDKREGASCYYRKIDNIEVELGFDKVNVFTYEVIEKQEDEIALTMNYFNTVYTGMKNRFPTEYIDKYLIGHCNDKFNMHIVNAHHAAHRTMTGIARNADTLTSTRVGLERNINTVISNI